MSPLFTPDLFGRYRYTLSRTIGAGPGVVLFVMLNPSTADDTVNDPTIRRCIGFARLWGFREMRVVNVLAARATNPKRLREMHDPVGPENDAVIAREVARADRVVAAWGASGGFEDRKREILATHADVRWWCLGTTKAGHPRHPLYVKADRPLERLEPSA